MTTEHASPSTTRLSAQERRAALASRLNELAEEKSRQVGAIGREQAQAHAEHAQRTQAAEQDYQSARLRANGSTAEDFLTRDEKELARAASEKQLRAALETRTRELDTARDARIAPLAAKERGVEAQYQQRVREAEEEERRTREALSSALLDDLYREVTPLAVRYLETPTKALAESIARSFHGFNRRATAELGSPLEQGLVACVFCDQMLKSNPALANKLESEWHFGHSNTSTSFPHQYDAFWRSFESGSRLINRALFMMVDALETCSEQALGEASAWSSRHYAARRRCSTASELGAASAALKREVEAEQQRAFQASYVPPKRPSLLDSYRSRASESDSAAE